jgi:glucose-6-phosphate dehydrogenase assembly protein OpcA
MAKMETAMSITTRKTIEKELGELWRPEQEGTEITGSGFHRNYTTNLVVFTLTREKCREAEAVLRELTPIHPGRFIMLCPAPESESTPLCHHVSGHCVTNPERNKQICCDIINLEAKAGVLEELYSLTLSLLISDLPVEFWWVDDAPQDGNFFRKIADDSDRVWVDSSTFHHPAKAIAHLAATWHQRFPNTVLADLNWLRFQRWRNLIAELFDGEWTPYLSQIRHMTIEYGEGRQPTRSFLLVCWMASRLGWRYTGQPLEDFPDEIEFDSGSGPVTVAIKPVPVADKIKDRLFAIRIHTGDTPKGEFSVVRDSDPQCVLAHSEIDDKVAFSRILHFEHLEAAQLLAQGLSHWGKDPGWEGTLAIFQTIIKKPAVV